ncbi:hypothetical protein FIBSPDRAFT_966013 [Athelia psychrophila]|uniref:Uncharacterized protein n=1 Tax=Athelia psychrophila TaxID=1759441 RepID=A0A167X9W7_9AGAM|nr:hypothetical protein FIBSPDRAFT_966013 [Fibularhizoctonia sp. CBS 109695]
MVMHLAMDMIRFCTWEATGFIITTHDDVLGVQYAAQRKRTNTHGSLTLKSFHAPTSFIPPSPVPHL